MNDPQSPSQLVNGFLVVRLKAGELKDRGGDLEEAARGSNLDALGDALAGFKVVGERLITSVPLARLEELEQVPTDDQPAPRGHLSDYWRLDVRHAMDQLGEIESAFRLLPVVDEVYQEKAVTDPVGDADDTHSGEQHFLAPAPVGVDARWVWKLPGGDGSGMQFVDLEQGWLRQHEDLPGPELIFGENRDGHSIYRGDHGSSVLGIVAGSDNDRGIIGLAPRARTRVVSCWSAAKGPKHIADALMAAVAATPRPDVVLLEVQTIDGYPVETDPAVRDAIRCAVANGIVVVEAGGNGGRDLDAWVDANGERRLDRNGRHFIDSGAILVGAAHSALPHDRWRGWTWKSNYGSRIDCYAWGEHIVSAGSGDLAGAPGSPDSYTRSFGGTSGASAIIAGCALLVQGLSRHMRGKLFKPRALRELLSNPLTGTAQGPNVPGHIGVMPDLRRIVEGELLHVRGAA